MVQRPILRYHGGKWMLAKWIISHFPAHRIYTEAYGGAASVLLQKSRAYSEIYNDLDNEVVNLFKILREQGPELIKFLELTPYSKSEYDLAYEMADTDFEQARRTIIRSFMGFASGIQSTQRTGFRSNSNQAGTTPARDWINYPRSLEQIIERMKGVVIENSDAIKIIKQHDSPHTVHYIDPPYKKNTRYDGDNTNVYKYEMNDENHKTLLACCCNDLEGMIILSGYDNELYNDTLSNWKKVQKNSIVSGGKGSIKRIETLWLSPNCHQQHKLF